MKPKKEIFTLSLIDGTTVRSSMKLHKFDYINYDVECSYTDADGDEIRVKQSEGDLWIESTGDWITWD